MTRIVLGSPYTAIRRMPSRRRSPRWCVRWKLRRGLVTRCLISDGADVASHAAARHNPFGRLPGNLCDQVVVGIVM